MSSTSVTTSPTLYAIPTITSYVNVGPMPTAITFPPNCLSDAYDFGADGIGLPYTYYTQGCALSSCCPSSLVYSSAFEWYSYYYSPAVCPSGYTQGPVDPIVSSASGENARWCCPTGFGQISASSYPTPTTTPYQNWICQQHSYNLSSTAYVYDNIFDQKFLSTETINSWFYAAYPIQIRWKDGDFDNIATITTASPSASSSSPVSATLSSSPVVNATSSSSPVVIPTGSAHHSLSTGAIAAIAVVVGVVAIAGMVFGALLIRRRSRRRAAASKTVTGHQVAMPKQESMLGIGSQPLSELLAPTETHHELDAGKRGGGKHGGGEPVELG